MNRTEQNRTEQFFYRHRHTQADLQAYTETHADIKRHEPTQFHLKKMLAFPSPLPLSLLHIIVSLQWGTAEPYVYRHS